MSCLCIPSSPLILPLLSLSPHIHSLKRTAQILSWNSNSQFEPLLLIAVWWFFCLFAATLFRFLLLPLLFFLFLFFYPRPQPQLLSESTLLNTISDLSTLHLLFPSLPSPPTDYFPLLRAISILYFPYLLISFLIPLRIIFAILGTLLLTWRAPWSILLRTTLLHSAWLRWSLYSSWSFLSGLPLPQKSFSPLSPSQPLSLRFLFSINENQRWWMGLDWTAALLPAERPSWCSPDPSHSPLSPPNAFSLPDPALVYLPDEKGTGRIKKIAEWHWEEPEWRVVVKRDGSNTVTRIEKPLLSSSESTTTTTLDEHPSEPFTDDNEPFTDQDGWVYGDNKWENQSSRGGISKYTRYRRWTRVAIVTEHVQHVDMGELGIKHPDPRPPPLPLAPTTVDSPLTSPSNVPESPLRQRLRMALHK